jgi:hypothetical protein
MKFPDNLTGAGTVIEEPGMQHHFFRIETQALVGG